MVICRIRDIQVVSDYRLRVGFDDGKVVVYDVMEDIQAIPSYAPLRDVPGLFRQVRLDESRTCVYWNSEIDLPSDVIYEYGIELAPARKVSCRG